MSLTFPSDTTALVLDGRPAVVFGTEWMAAVFDTFSSDASVLVRDGGLAVVFGTEWIACSTFPSYASVTVRDGGLAVVFGTEWIVSVFVTFPSYATILGIHGHYLAVVFDTERSFVFRHHSISVRIICVYGRNSVRFSSGVVNQLASICESIGFYM